MPSTAPGVTSASLIVIILTGAAIGALVGGILGPYLETAPLAISAGFIATIIAGDCSQQVAEPLFRRRSR